MATIIWELNIGDLFRIDGSWYRLQKQSKDKGVLEVVGSKEATGAYKTAELPLDTEITELSVLSKRVNK